MISGPGIGIFLCRPAQNSFAGTRVVAGPVDGCVLEIDLSSGEVTRRVPYTVEGWVRAADGRVIVVAGARKISCLSAADGRVLWEHDWRLPYVACADGRIYVRRELSDDFACVDLETGACLWVFRAPAEGSGGNDDRTHVIFDFGVCPDYDVVVTRNGRVYKLEPTMGHTIAVGRPEVLGLPLVTPQSVFFKRPAGSPNTVTARSMKSTESTTGRICARSGNNNSRQSTRTV